MQDWGRYESHGRIDLARVKEAMALLFANDGALRAEWRDHALAGREWDGCRELHVGGDLLLVYRRAEGAVTFVRLGTHSELFGR